MDTIQDMLLKKLSKPKERTHSGKQLPFLGYYPSRLKKPKCVQFL